MEKIGKCLRKTCFKEQCFMETFSRGKNFKEPQIQ